MRARRILFIVATVVVILLIVAVSAVFVFTGTDWGRERVRRFALNALANSAHGIVQIGEVDGNLLQGAILRHVRITDSTGAPFVDVEEVRARYQLSDFWHKHISLDHVTLVHPIVVLDRKAGGKWNYDRIFPRDTTSKPTQAPGFGSWVVLTNVTVVDGDLTAKAPWSPSDTLKGRVRDSVIAFNLGPKGRQNIVRVDSGFQRISKFHAINGLLSRLQIADPTDRAQTYDVAHLRSVAEPFRPPTVTVTDLTGRFIVRDDSLYFHGVRAQLAESKLAGDGRYNIDNNDLRLRLHADPVSTNDLQWIDPTIPKQGIGALDFALDWVGPNSDYVARNATLKVAGATLQGNLGVLVNDTLTFHDTDMRFARLDTRTIAQLFPTLKSPRQGYLTGRMIAAGSINRLTLDGDVAFDDPITGRSRVVAKGVLGLPKIGVTADQLHLTLMPVQVALGRIAMPTLPIGGTVTGQMLLNGSTTRQMNVQSDLTHHDVTGNSRITGHALYAPGKIPLVNADLLLHPLSLATVGKFAPAAGLHGTVTGPVRLTGPLRDLALDATLTTPDSGSISAQGHADLASKVPVYNFAIATHLFNANVVSTKAPRTNVTASATAQGSGITAESVNATVAADVKTSRYDSLTVDSALIRVRLANGLLHADSVVVRLPHTIAQVAGTVGLTPAHSGELRYTTSIDSLGALSQILPPTDTGVVRPRPGILAERLARAVADSAKLAKATEVQRAMTGVKIPAVSVDSPSVIPANRLLGKVDASGILRGNIKTFDLDGTAHGSGIVAYGNSANVVSASYAWHNALTPQSNIRATVAASNVSAAGFSLDTITAQGTYQKPRGTVKVAIQQGADRKYNVNADFALNKTRNDIYLNDLKLQFDSTTYASARPALIHFGTAGIDVDSLDIRGNRNDSRVFVAGHIPKSGDVALRFNVVNFDVGNVMSLLESDVPVRGLVSADGTLGGTTENPVIRGAFGTARMTYKGTPVPEVHGRLDYATQSLSSNVAANLEGQAPLLTAVGTVPVNLALTGVVGSRVPKGRAIDVKIDSDSLPLERLPHVSEAVTNLGGSALIHARVVGTLDKPDATGQFLLNDARAKLVPAGVTVDNVNGSIRLLHDSVMIDSLVARSGGPIRINGGVNIASIAKPKFGVQLVAANAKVLDNEMGMVRTDAYLTLNGSADSVAAGGSVRLISGVIYIPESDGKQVIAANDPAIFSVIDTALATNKELFPSTSPFLRHLRADVGITIDHDVFVRSRDANVEIYTDGPLQITMAPRRNRAMLVPVLDGVILTDRGEYRFQSRRFIIRHGSATFINTPQLNPTLQVTGEYEVQLPAREAITIRILISGTLDSPKIALESDAQPPIAQTDLLSYLAFGRSSSSLLQQEGSGLSTGGGGSSSNLVGRAAALAQQQVAGAAVGAVTDQIAGEAARSLGADVLNITPADVSPDVGNFLRATQIEFGKYIYTRTFLGLQFRPDPASLKRPGFQLDRVLDVRRGYSLQMSFEPRYLVLEPSLSQDDTPQTTSVFGLFLVREWRY